MEGGGVRGMGYLCEGWGEDDLSFKWIRNGVKRGGVKGVGGRRPWTIDM